ncbi:hypothetical protein [Campylobacter troglodytis]|uniref:hypothetical protein n=1 Tax=Campylobacter troglodytis TaxID=654363 RepID=UPI0011593978|nr:hypothetical protein [Campylobacter troglodytis]TQR59619.1 hypothetical protein DMC01_07160 [Campylobacter troglodytis]
MIKNDFLKKGGKFCEVFEKCMNFFSKLLKKFTPKSKNSKHLKIAKKFTQTVNLWILRLFYKKAKNDKACVNFLKNSQRIRLHFVRQCKFSQKIHKKAKND